MVLSAGDKGVAKNKSKKYISRTPGKPPIQKPSVTAKKELQSAGRAVKAVGGAVKGVFRPSSGKTAQQMAARQGVKPNYGGTALDSPRQAKTLGPKRPIVTMKDVSTPFGANPKSAGKAAIMAQQRSLNKAGAHLVVDGIWGPKTQAAYNQYVKHTTPSKPKPAPKKPAKPAPRAPVRPAGGGKGGGKPVGGGGGVGGGSVSRAAAGPSAASIATGDLKKAASSVDMVLNPMLGELARQAADIRANYDKMSKEEKDRAVRQQSDLKQIYDRLGNYLTGQKSDTDKKFADARKNISDVYDHLDATLKGDFEGAKAQTESETNRLGIGAVNSSATQGLTRDQEFLRGLVGASKAGQETSLRGRESGYDALQSLLQGQAGVEGGTRRAQATRESNKRLSDISFERTRKLLEPQGKASDLRGTRGERIRQAVEAIQNARDEKEMELRQQEFTEAIQGARLDVDRDRLALDRTTKDKAASLAQARLDRDVSNDKWKRAHPNAGKTPPKSQTVNTGYQAASAYISKAAGAGTDKARRLQAIFNLALTADNGKLKYNVSDPNAAPKMMAAMRGWLHDNGYGGAEENILMAALQRHFAKKSA